MGTRRPAGSPARLPRSTALSIRSITTAPVFMRPPRLLESRHVRARRAGPARAPAHRAGRRRAPLPARLPPGRAGAARPSFRARVDGGRHAGPGPSPGRGAADVRGALARLHLVRIYTALLLDRRAGRARARRGLRAA